MIYTVHRPLGWLLYFNISIDSWRLSRPLECMACRRNVEFSPAKRRTGLELIRRRFPSRSDLLAVFGVAVFVCYTWTLFGFFNKLSSFLLYFTLAEIGNIFAFMMAFTLLESLAVTALLAVLSAVLPSTWLREGFALKGFVILLIATAASILFQKYLLGGEYPSPLPVAALFLAALLLCVGLITWIHNMPRVQSILAGILDRIQIMRYVYVPIGLFALVVVLYQNLL